MTDSKVPVIAIDGPTATGKGTVARAGAKAIKFHFLDSGALYRLVALAAIQGQVSWHDTAALAQLARKLQVTFDADQIFLDEQNVTDDIRTEVCSDGSSRVAAHGAVRDALLQRQRDFRRPPGLVADGRDMGTVVFPDAVLKIFLTASAEARSERRHKQLKQKGITANIDFLLKDLRERDERDMSRSAAPLKPSPDAQLLDTSALTAVAATEKVLAWYRGLRSKTL